MPKKTRAEIQKAYRERKKQDRKFQQKESRRVLKYYKSTLELDDVQLKERRRKNRENQRKCRERKRELNRDARCHSPLKVKIKMPPVLAKRRKTLIAKNKKIKSLEARIALLQKNNRKIKKRNQRLLQGMTNSKSTETTVQAEMTPKSRTNTQIREAGIRDKGVAKNLRKRLLFSNVLVDEIRDSVQKNSNTVGSRAIRNIISGNIAKKYKIMRTMSMLTGLSRNLLSNIKSKLVSSQKKTRLVAIRETLQKSVVEFLERDDNSRMMPGKNDAKKCGATKVQKRILSDYLYNLRLKYLSENPTSRISQSTFYKMRPAYMQLACFASRDTCLCVKHQNMALFLRAMKNRKLISNVNPDAFIKEKNNEDVADILKAIPDNEEIIYDQWKRVEVEGKQRMKTVSHKASKQTFIHSVTEELKKFREHVKRHHEQYKQLRALKGNLPEGHIILQMDFAENYSCQSCEEVQSAYWNGPTMVTLHPVVAYYKVPDEEKLQHKSFIFVSDDLSHNATAVYTIISALFPHIKEQVPNISHVHYWTDSPTSQYRNKTIFAILTNPLCGVWCLISATWNYFEAGHGKGPCDGVGGSAKRMADEAVRNEKVVIDDAQGFFAWATKSNDSTSVKYIFYSKDDLQNSATKLSQYSDVQSVPGTMTFHAVAATEAQNKIIARTTSCYCTSCLANPQESQCRWNTFLLRPLSQSNVQSQLALKAGDFMAASYDNDWYIGKVEEIDPADGEVKVTFMERAGNNTQSYKFRWPAREDVLWVTKDDILCVIEPPIQVGKTRKSYHLSSATLQLIEGY